MKKKLQPTPAPKPMKAYKPQPHPQQARLDAIRAIPSLVTTHTHLIPNGKGD